MRTQGLAAVVLAFLAGTGVTRADTKEEREAVQENRRLTDLRPVLVFVGSGTDDGLDWPGAVEQAVLDAANDARFLRLDSVVAPGAEAVLAEGLRAAAEASLEAAEDEGTTDERAREIQRAFRLDKKHQRTRAIDDQVKEATFLLRLQVKDAKCRTGTRTEKCTGAAEITVFRMTARGTPAVSEVERFTVSETQQTDLKESGAAKAARFLTTAVRVRLRGVPGLGLSAPITVGSEGLALNLGADEGVELDQAFTLWNQLADGTWERAGYAKVREVGPGQAGPSFAQLIFVDDGFTLRGGELAREYPLSGGSFAIAGGAFRGQEKLLGAVSASLLVSVGLARATGVSELSAELEVEGGFAQGIETPPAALLAGLGFRKKIQLRRLLVGVGVAATGGLAGEVGGRGDVSLEYQAAARVGVGLRAGAIKILHFDGTAASPLTPYARAFLETFF